MVALKDLMANLGSPNIDCRQDGAKLDPKFFEAQMNYAFVNLGFRGFEQAQGALASGDVENFEFTYASQFFRMPAGALDAMAVVAARPLAGCAS